MEMKKYVPRILRDDGMIEASEVAHYTHLNLIQYVRATDVEQQAAALAAVEKNYQAAVKGRQDFRQAYREAQQQLDDAQATIARILKAYTELTREDFAVWMDQNTGGPSTTLPDSSSPSPLPSPLPSCSLPGSGNSSLSIEQLQATIQRLTEERESLWLRFAATGTHEDFMVSLDDLILREFQQGERLATVEAALKPFTFKATPDKFLGRDGEVTETLVCDADVQRARQAMLPSDQQQATPMREATLEEAAQAVQRLTGKDSGNWNRCVVYAVDAVRQLKRQALAPAPGGHIPDASKMVWTKVKPTVPGWYWWRAESFYVGEKCVEIVRDFFDRSIRVSGDDAFLKGLSLDEIPGEWCGPLHAPGQEGGGR